MNDPIQLALNLIKQFEGCKLTAYTDIRGVWTIGWGTTAPAILQFLDRSDYPLPAQGVVWTQDLADRALQETVEQVASSLVGLLEPAHIHPSANQLAALIDFVYNVGLHNFEKSGCLRALKLGDLQAAADNLLLWNKIGDATIPGLVRRREAERALFLQPDENK